MGTRISYPEEIKWKASEGLLKLNQMKNGLQTLPIYRMDQIDLFNNEIVAYTIG